jgi:hypothetical protein
MIAPLYLRSSAVRHGTLSVPAKAEHDFELAADYLERDSGMRAIFDKAEHAGRLLHLKLNHHDDDSYDPMTRTVNWDPHSALHTTAGGRQSPALGLGHELDHAVVDGHLAEVAANAYDPKYDNREERRVIIGSEAHAAQTLGEDVRRDHGGWTYRVASPIER